MCKIKLKFNTQIVYKECSKVLNHKNRFEWQYLAIRVIRLNLSKLNKKYFFITRQIMTKNERQTASQKAITN